VRNLDCQFFFNSNQHRTVPPASAFTVDLARDPSYAHQLIKLGISPRKDLPAVLLTDAGGKLRLVGLRVDRDEADQLLQGRAFADEELVLYSATWCPDCRRLKDVLARVGVEYREVDLDLDATSEALVLERSGGRRVVPTLRFGDRLFAFNPGPDLVRSLIEESFAASA
jgi:glutaredoxin